MRTIEVSDDEFRVIEQALNEYAVMMNNNLEDEPGIADEAEKEIAILDPLMTRLFAAE